MLLELLHRIAFITSTLAALVWAAAAIIDPTTLYLAGASLGVAFASCLIPFNYQHQTPQPTPITRSLLAFLWWSGSGLGLAYSIFLTNVSFSDLGFFSPCAIVVCWLGLLPLLLVRNPPSARRTQS
jgi:hypothetical protein